jgi:hypothetical protein
MAWNANGLLQHKDELQATLHIENIDICLISETHFTRESYIKLTGYTIYHTTHPANTARGGSALIIRNNIPHYEEEKYATPSIQATTVTLLSTNQTLTVSAIYCPPRHLISADQYLTFFCSLKDRFIIGGDFNAKHTHWGSRLTTPKGRQLYTAAINHNCEFVSTRKPTYWPSDQSKTPDLIDFFITKNISPNYMQIDEGNGLTSDHSPILLTISEHIITKDRKPTLTNNLTDWDYFNFLLDNSINLRVPLQTPDQLDEEVHHFTTHIQNAAWKSTPTVKTKFRGPNYPREIREMIVRKRRARRRWHQSRAPQDKATLNRISQQLTKELKDIKNYSFNIFLTNLTADKSTDYSLWKAAKCPKQPQTHVTPIRKPNGQWARTNNDKTITFATHLETRFQPHPGTDNLPVLPSNSYEDTIPLVTPKEVKEEIYTNLQTRKTPGFDLITGVILKKLQRKALVKLTTLINAAIRLKYVPISWKVSEIILVPKPGKNHTEVESYRPIALLPTMAKLLEKLILKRLNPIISKYQLIPPHQFGFRSKHSTIDQVHRITEVIEKALEEQKVCSALFLDVSQAFDRVWHDGLLHKLRSLLPEPFYLFLKSYLHERQFRIKYETTYSPLSQLRAGVPQGSVLGPVLYLLYINDVPQTPDSTIATFADDTAVMATGRTPSESTAKLRRAAENIVSWTHKWRIKLNEAKSTFVHFTNQKTFHQTITLNGVTLQPANTAKYLGMTLDTKLRWKAHVKKKHQELQIKLRKLYWLIGPRSHLSIHNKLLLYKQILKPVWLYGAPLWGCATKSNISVIQRFQNKVLRCIVNAPWYTRNTDLHRDLGVVSVLSAIKRCATSHHIRLQHHTNVEAASLLYHGNITRRLKRTKPFELLLQPLDG